MANLSAACFMRVAATMPSAGDHFPQRDFWPGIIFALPVGSRPVKPFCSMACHLQLNTKFLLQLRYS
jgi:hypothetical protein